MSGFVLIPLKVYENNVAVGINHYGTDNSSIEQVQLDKQKLLESTSQFKSQLLPFIPQVEPQPVQQQQQQQETHNKQKHSALSSKVDNLEVPQAEEIKAVENIVSELPLDAIEGVKLQRVKVLLYKFYKNKRFGLSRVGDTIILDGVDTGINLGTYLYRLQKKLKLTPIERDIKNILEVQPHQMRHRWVKIN